MSPPASRGPVRLPEPANTCPSTFRDDNLEIFAGDHERFSAATVETIEQTLQIGMQRGLSGRVKRFDRLHPRAIVFAEWVKPSGVQLGGPLAPIRRCGR